MTIEGQKNLFSKLFNVFRSIPQKLEKGYSKSWCITGWVHTELWRKCHQLVLSCARLPIKKLLFPAAQIVWSRLLVLINLRLIGPPLFDDPAEPHLGKSDIPKDCFEPNNSSEANPKDIGLSPTCNETTLPTQSLQEKENKKTGIGFRRWIDNQSFLAINLRSRALRVCVELP